MICTECYDTGMIIKTEIEDGIETEYAYSCPTCFHKSPLFKRKLGEAGIPEEFWAYTFDSYVGTQSLDIVNNLKKYVAKVKDESFSNVSIYLYGKHSCQKSTLASILGKEFLRVGYRVYYILAGDLIDLMIKSSGYDASADAEFELSIIRNIDFLIIDDIFDAKKAILWKNNSDQLIASWDKLFRFRNDNKLRFIMTSNVDLPSIVTNYGESMFELIDRYTVKFELKDSVKAVRTNKLLELFKD